MVVIVFGIVACFFGYCLFRVIFAIAGFLAGAALGVLLAGSLALASGQETLVRIVLGLVGGLIVAGVAWFLYIVAVFLSGAGIGASIGAAIALAVRADNTVQLILIIALAILAGVIAVALQKLFIILATAFGGAQLIVSGVSLLLATGGTVALFNPLDLLPPGREQAVPALYVPMLVVWFVLGLAGVFVQYGITARAARPGVAPATEPTSDTHAEKDVKAA